MHRTLLVGLSLLYATLMFGSANVSAVQPAATVAVSIIDFGFTPATRAVQIGDTVTWTNTGNAPHNVKSTAGSTELDSPNLSNGQTFQHTFTTPGTYQYICSLHPNSMRGTITVQAAATPTPPPSGQRGILLPLVANNNTVGGPVGPPPTGPSWNNPSTWPDNRVPRAGDTVTIPAGKTVLLDSSPPPLKGLTIDGTLAFAERDITLTADWIMVHGQGRLQIGSATRPFPNKAVISLTGTDPKQDIMGMGTKFLGTMMGGKIELYGQPRVPWTRLSATAERGANQLTLDKPVDWQPGDRIVLASTDFDMEQAEEVTVTAVNGATVSFAPALKYTHFGQMQTFGGLTIDTRGEVTLLSRNVRIEGEASSSSTGFGGHIMIMDTGSIGRFDHVEITRMGQEGVLRRYALHYHLLFDEGANSYIKNSALHHTFNRCIVVHGTNKLRVERNTCFDNIGHAFFLEDGAEVENQFIENLGLLTRKPKPGKEVLISDGESIGPATFWITNPRNTFRGNVAAGSQGTGFWFSMPQEKLGLVQKQAPEWYKEVPFAEWKLDFVNNVAHSNQNGLFQDGCQKADGSTQGCFWGPIREKARDLGLEPLPSDLRVYSDFGSFTGYKNDLAIWTRGMYQRFRDVRLADNANGIILACLRCEIDGGLIAGETANKGNPRPGERTGPFGNSLVYPTARDYDQVIVGYRFYDGPQHIKNITFANFRPGKLSDGADRRETAAISFNTGIAAANTSEGIRFVNTPDTNRVSMFGGVGFSFEDLDGSIAGVPAVLADPLPTTVDSGCETRPGWVLRICPRVNGRYNFVDVWWYPSENPGGTRITGVVRDDGATYIGESHIGRYTFDASRTNRLTFAQMPQPELLLRFDFRRGDTWRFSMPYPRAPQELQFKGGIPPVIDQGNITLAAVNSLGALTPNTYFYDAAAQTLYIYAAPPYKDYAYSEGVTELVFR